MADNDQGKHISQQKLERFSMRNLPEAELSTIFEHVSECSACGAEFVSTLRRQREESGLSFTLAPEFWLRHDHLDYAHLVDLAENKLDSADRELIDAHLKVCQACQADVTNFAAFREQIAPELKVSYAPVRKGQEHKTSFVGWWSTLKWKPVYSVAVVAIAIGLVIGIALLLNRRADNQRAGQVPPPQVSPTFTPDSRIATAPTPASPNQSPPEDETGAPLIALSDSSGTVSIDKSGNVVGLDNVPPATRDEIGQVLIARNIEPAAILKELDGRGGGLRGGSTKQPFTLNSPLRTVIVSDRPVFKWTRMAGAASYTVYVTDAAGRELGKSEAIPSKSTQWVSTKALPRGQVYSWSVVALVDGREIVSPGPSAPEMKFQVLSASNSKQLATLRKTKSHLALGVFYSRVGMMAEAQHEFEQLMQLNPNSDRLRALLNRIKAIRAAQP